MPRPDNLAEFRKPPLSEVAVSVQFPAPLKYRNIYAQEVWALFQDRFPDVQEQLYLPPSFEVFGGPFQPALPFNFGGFLPPVRYWFTHPAKAEIIQFQPDRFIHNWRRVGNQEYPRYDQICDCYVKDLERLDSHYKAKGWGDIAPNQCELTYVNNLPLIDSAGQPLSKTFYLKNVDMSLGERLEGFTAKFQTIIKDKNASPIGRLSIDATTVIDVSGSPLILLTLVVRGAPAKPTILAAHEFLSDARDLIVTTFTEITTDQAHEVWERIK